MVFIAGAVIGYFYLSYPLKYEDIIERESSALELEPSLVKSVIWTESKFKADAKSAAGAIGLMQLMPSTAKWCAEVLGKEYSEESLYQPETNIIYGTFYLKYLLTKFDERMALAAYNAGEGRVKEWIEKGITEIPIKETSDYIDRAYKAKKIYSKR